MREGVFYLFPSHLTEGTIGLRDRLVLNGDCEVVGRAVGAAFVLTRGHFHNLQKH